MQTKGQAMKTNLDYLITASADTEASAYALYTFQQDDARGTPVAGGVAANDNRGLFYG